MRVFTRLRHLAVGLAALPLLALPSRRRLWQEMRAYVRGLPAALEAPLPAALAAQTPAAPDLDLPAWSVRLLADTAALAERDSPLGLCLRRSLVRYHYLRRAGVPVVLHFGARFKNGTADRDIAGHAWSTVHGRPYYEDGENYRDFTVMLTFPTPGS